MSLTGVTRGSLWENCQILCRTSWLFQQARKNVHKEIPLHGSEHVPRSVWTTGLLSCLETNSRAEGSTQTTPALYQVRFHCAGSKAEEILIHFLTLNTSLRNLFLLLPASSSPPNFNPTGWQCGCACFLQWGALLHWLHSESLGITNSWDSDDGDAFSLPAPLSSHCNLPELWFNNNPPIRNLFPSSSLAV